MTKKQIYPTNYKKQAILTVLAIIFFIAVYVLILLVSFSLVLFLFYSSTLLLKFASSKSSITFYMFIFFTMNITAGILLVFIIRFFFRKQTIDRSGWIEVSKEEQPKLYDIIESISNFLGTNFPQKVYLGAGVDAMVFYDSNFKNIFFPGKENLMIGLGLVNSMTDIELKTIIAHEFGHFTQRSLNVFSYIYIENQIIYKMLIDEQYYQTLILKFTQIGRLSWIVIYYSQFIRFILRKAYHVVLKSYMALSREMEFHADEVSANIGGSGPAISALLRLSLAYDSFNSVWQFYYSKISENIKAENVYPQHKFVMNDLAKKNNLQIRNGIPQVTAELLSSFNNSKIVFQDQWASHPSITERINRIERLHIDSTISYESAWNIFVNPEDVQKQITEKLFRNWEFSESPALMDQKEFEVKFLREIQKNKYDERYSHFYQFRSISKFDIKSVLEDESNNIFKNFNELYSENNMKLIFEFTGLTDDIRTIESISRGEIEIDIYEYNGIKYKSKESTNLCEQLKKRHEEMYKKIVELDIKIFKFFYTQAKLLDKEQELENKYQSYFYLVEEDKSNLKIYLDLINSIQFMYRVHSFNHIKMKMDQLKIKENIFRDQIKKILEEENYRDLLSENQREKFQKYLSAELVYFNNQQYNQDALKVLEETIYQFYELCSSAPYYGLRKLLDFQIEVLDNDKIKS